ncbi:hypothetical protein SAV14893_058510 [Streptomyces avermitilis]|uniref:Uncharacterized protein n=1 Tax=Streptomyces avermitilis TaxID=33903 RepID=A0A4D4MMJ8_STRAX|nr:hypothetical protein SAVMC3_70840 [Streptomyces avermitilis]GDY66458.1 hypothetical protein SAV14893_058510 [Streptomyces avermitilis]GDY73308.1 hypothetical protein SAV31267_027930 [Streptomyces avermitilis]GDY82406.1 hypothetical protein SAVCW2_16050 [Streptomyces avermitilis]
MPVAEPSPFPSGVASEPVVCLPWSSVVTPGAWDAARAATAAAATAVVVAPLRSLLPKCAAIE